MPLLDTPIQNPSAVMNGVRTSPALPSIPRMNGGIHAPPHADWVRMRRPYLDDYGQACVSLTDIHGRWTANDSRGGERKPLVTGYYVNDLLFGRYGRRYRLPPVVDAVTLRRDQWIELDKKTIRAYRQRLTAWDDLSSAASYGGFNAMGRMTLEWYKMNDPGEAVVDMDARTDGRTDTPLLLLQSLPLPITHSDWGWSARELAVSQSGDLPFDTVGAEAGARRIAEVVEDTLIGMITGTTYGTQTTGYGTHTGTSTVYGYRNFPQRLTKTNFTTPTTTNGPTSYAEVLAALDQLRAQYVYGPFVLYHSTEWTQYMDSPFSTAGGNHPSETLRTMLMKIPEIQDVRRLDRLTGLTGGGVYTLIFVSMDGNTVQAVNGMDITTVQWEEKGGLEVRFKIMCIQVPRFMSDYNSRTGVLHGTTA